MPEPASPRKSLRDSLGELLGGLVRRGRLAAPSDLAALVAERAHGIGADEVVVYLVDYGQTMLVPLPGLDAADRGALAVDATLAGRVFRKVEMLETEARLPGRRRLWVPLLDGTERLGVMELTFEGPGPLPPELREVVLLYAGLVAELIVTKQAYGDLFEFVRRRGPMQLAAEVQWRLLPPLTFGTDDLVIAGALEPWQEVGGDTFDYAVNGELTSLALFDAMGHGLGATIVASVTVGAYRNARRNLCGLAETYARIDAVLTEHFAGEQFVTAILAELETDSGRFRWISAGHPPPLLLRGGKLVKSLEIPPSLPLGMPFDPSTVVVGEELLEPGDRLVLYTDGVTEARDAKGDFFTAERLGQFVVREAASGQPAPETLRRLSRAILDHQLDKLQDDATTMLIEWKRGAESWPRPEVHSCQGRP